MKHFLKRALPGFLAVAMLAVPTQAADNGSQFEDVSANAYYAEAVEWAVKKGVTKGTSDSEFSPASTVTRAQAVTFLWRAAGEPEPSAGAPTFNDTADQNAYYYKAVRWAAGEGITNGVTATQFEPHSTLHYDQILAFLCRAAGADAAGGSWSQKAQDWASSNGITDGLTFAAKANCPRADAVYFLWQQLADSEAEIQQPEKPEEEQPEKQEPVDPERPVLSDEAGAIMVILNGFSRKSSAIDISDFGLEASQAEALALEIADIDGENPYSITSLNAYEQDGQLAKTLAVYYTTSTIQIYSPDMEKISAEVERVVDQVVSPGMNDYDIAKALHDYVVLHCDYDMRYYTGGLPVVSYNAEGMLLEGTAVCAGYSKAYQLLMEEAGIPCEYITGTANGGSHGWNIVNIDGQWYHVDTTWDDPTNMGSDFVRYDYFLKSDSYMRRDHRWNTATNCTSTTYDGLDLPAAGEQAQQQQQQQQAQEQKQEQFSAIRQILEEAIAALPYQTEAEIESASYEDLVNARYAYIPFDESYDSLTLQEAFQSMADDLREKYPHLSFYGYDREHHGYEIYRKDLVEAANKIQAAENAARKELQEQHVAEIVALIQEAIRNRQEECRLEGYTFTEVGMAYRIVRERGYTFDGYTAGEHYNLGGYNAYKVEIHYLSD